jgi:hypothetical protein
MVPGEASVNELVERAHETVHEHGHGAAASWTRGVAILVSCLAASLALTQVGEHQEQNLYLTNHIQVSDDWALYQAKNLRATVRLSEANMLELQPNAAEPAVQARIAEAKEYAARMRDDPKGGDGMKQMGEKAHAREHDRDHAYHRYHQYEYAAGALEIGIVLASVAVVTSVPALAIGAGVIGLAASGYSLAVALHWL